MARQYSHPSGGELSDLRPLALLDAPSHNDFEENKALGLANNAAHISVEAGGRVVAGALVTYPHCDVARLMQGPALVLRPDATIREAAAALRAMNSSAALVGGRDSIVTERDLTKAWSHGLSGDEPVSDIATDHPLVVDGRVSIEEAAGLMLNREIRHLIVIDEGQVGIVSLRTVMAVLLQAIHPDLWLAQLRLRITDVPEVWLG